MQSKPSREKVVKILKLNGTSSSLILAEHMAWWTRSSERDKLSSFKFEFALIVLSCLSFVSYVEFRELL